MKKGEYQRFKDALHYALVNYERKSGQAGKTVKRGESLKHIAKRLIHIAINSNEKDSLLAIKEIADRLDGKATQSITGNEGEPITMVKRIIVQNETNNRLGEKIIDAEVVQDNQGNQDKVLIANGKGLSNKSDN